jgi:hypothetical protein
MSRTVTSTYSEVSQTPKRGLDKGAKIVCPSAPTVENRWILVHLSVPIAELF